MREIKANLFPRVPIYVAAEGLPAVFRVSRHHCHFYFCSIADGRTRRENRFSLGNSSPSFATKIGATRHRLSPTSLFPPLFLSPALPIILRLIVRRQERRISRVSILRAPRTNSRVIDIAAGCVMCVITIEKNSAISDPLAATVTAVLAN